MILQTPAADVLLSSNTNGRRRSYMDRYKNDIHRGNLKTIRNKYGAQAIFLLKKVIDPACEVGPVLIECHAMLAALEREERALTERIKKAKFEDSTKQET